MKPSKLSKVVTSQSFVLVDPNGMEHARLAAIGGASVLTMYDSARRTRVKLTVRVDGPSLAFYDGKGVARTRLNVRNDVPKLELFDAGGNKRARLAVQKSVYLQLYDQHGKALHRIP